MVDEHLKAMERETKKQTRKNIKAAGKVARKSFAVCRIKKYKTAGAISNLSKHNLRNGEQPLNADPAKAHLNQIKVVNNADNLLDAVHARINEAGVKPRKDSVLMIEQVLTFSPEAQPKDLKAWGDDSIKWAETYFGKDNIVGVQLHMDETTPHIHLQIVPIVETRRKKRGSDEYGEPKPQLNAKHYCGGKAKLSKMQDSYAAAMEKHGLKRGIVKSGNHNENHIDVRTRRGELAEDYEREVANWANERGLLDIEQRYNKLETKLNETEFKLAQATRHKAVAEKHAKTIDMENKSLKRKLEIERSNNDDLRDENAKLNRRLDEVDPARRRTSAVMRPSPRPRQAPRQQQAQNLSHAKLS